MLFSSCPKSLPPSGSFPMSWLFTSGGQSMGASASVSVLPVNVQGWFPLGLTDLISLLSEGLSRVLSSTTVQKHPSFSAQPSLQSNFDIHTWLLEKTVALTIQTFVDTEKAMAPHSSTLAWKIPWTEEPGRLQSMGSLRVRHSWATSLSLFTFLHWRRKWQPTPVFLTGKSHGRRSLVGCSPWGRYELDMTERLHFHFVGKVIYLLFNTLSSFVIDFLPESKHLLISGLHSLFTVILEPKKIKPVYHPHSPQLPECCWSRTWLRVWESLPCGLLDVWTGVPLWSGGTWRQGLPRAAPSGRDLGRKGSWESCL